MGNPEVGRWHRRFVCQGCQELAVFICDNLGNKLECELELAGSSLLICETMIHSWSSSWAFDFYIILALIFQSKCTWNSAMSCTLFKILPGDPNAQFQFQYLGD